MIMSGEPRCNGLSRVLVTPLIIAEALRHHHHHTSSYCSSSFSFLICLILFVSMLLPCLPLFFYPTFLIIFSDQIHIII